MNGWHWAVGVLGVTTVVSAGAWARERGWILSGGGAAVAATAPRAVAPPGPDEAERKARALRLAEDLGLAQRLLGEAEGELAASRAELSRERSQCDDDRSDRDEAVRLLRDLQRRYAPTEELGPVLLPLVRWSGTALESMERDRDQARRQAGQESGRADAAEEGLRREKETRDREKAQSEATVTDLEGTLQVAATRLQEFQSALESAQAQVDLGRKNNRLVLHNTGDDIFIEWAVVFHKTENGHVAARTYSFGAGEDNMGYVVDSGGDFDFGEGVALVLQAEPKEENGSSYHYWLTAPVGSDGRFDFSWRW